MGQLTPEQLLLLQGLLQQQQLSLEEHIRTETGQLSDEPFSQLAGGMADHAETATADLIVDLDHAKIGLQLAQLRDITKAHERIRDDTYGQCLDCGDDIAFARLHAYPVAKRCLACQQVREHARGEVHAKL